MDRPATGAAGSACIILDTVSDDGIQLWVNGQQLVDDWQLQAATWSYGVPITLQAGQRYDISINYFNGPTASAAYLYWSYPGQEQELVPRSYLYGQPSCMLDNTSINNTLPVGSLVANLLVAPGEAGVTLSCALVPGDGSDDNAAFTIDGTRLLSAVRLIPPGKRPIHPHWHHRQQRDVQRVLLHLASLDSTDGGQRHSGSVCHRPQCLQLRRAGRYLCRRAERRAQL